jgi:uncharacterized protein
VRYNRLERIEVITIAHVVLKRRVLPLALALAAGLSATGCRTYQQQNKVIRYWHQGDLPNAVAEADRMADRHADNKDAVIWRLEQGAVLRGAGKYEESNQAFDQAQAKIDDYAQKARVRVGQETAALLSNQANLAYEGRAYDGIMLNTYRALNYLQLGEIDKARPELIRAYQRQKDAVADNQKRIERVRDEAAASKDKATIDKAEQDPELKSRMDRAYSGLNGLQAYADYVNPFTVYLDGLYFMANAADGSDLERARKSLERAAGFAPDNNYVKQDLAAVERLQRGKPLTPTTYVIFETGGAPLRDQIRIDIPILVSKVSYVGAAFPVLRFQDDYLPALTVTANGTTATTALIASMDSIIGLDFKNELPVVITKTIAATVTKAVAGYALNETARQTGGDWAELASQLLTAGGQIAVNIADERTWTTLPKEFQVCRLPTPPDRKLELKAPDGGQNIPVTIADGTINLIYVKSITATGPLLVTQFKLK